MDAPRFDDIDGEVSDAPPVRFDEIEEGGVQVSPLETFGQNLADAPTFGFADEIGAGMQAGLGSLTGEEGSFGDRYRQARDENRMLKRVGDVQNPRARVAGTVSGLAASAALPIPGGAAKTVAGTALQGMAMGAAYGAGSSEADNAWDLARDTVGGSLIGAGAGAAGGVIGKGLGWAGGKVGAFADRKIAGAVADETAAQTAKAEKAIASAKGAFGSSVQSASRDLEVLEREAAAGATPSAAKARALLASPDGVALRERVLAAKLNSAPDRIADTAAKEGELSALVSGKSAAIQVGTDGALAHPFKTQVAPRLKTYLSRAIPPVVGSYLGSEIGGTEGVVAGGMLGLGTAAVMGRPGTALANMAKSPAFRKMGWETVKSLLGTAPERLGQFAAPLSSAAARGEKQFAAAHFVLAQKSEEYRRMIANLFGDDSEEERRAAR